MWPFKQKEKPSSKDADYFGNYLRELHTQTGTIPTQLSVDQYPYDELVQEALSLTNRRILIHKKQLTLEFMGSDIEIVLHNNLCRSCGQEVCQ